MLLLGGVWNYSHTVVDDFNGLPTLTVYFLGLVNDYLFNKLSYDFGREFGYLSVSFYKPHKLCYIVRINFCGRKLFA